MVVGGLDLVAGDFDRDLLAGADTLQAGGDDEIVTRQAGADDAQYRR